MQNEVIKIDEKLLYSIPSVMLNLLSLGEPLAKNI